MSARGLRGLNFPLLKRDVRMQSRFMLYFGTVVVALMLLVILVVGQRQTFTAMGQIEKRGGVIVNFASQAGRRGEANVMLYCSTKAAVISVTQSMAQELAGYNIRVNAIAPGVIDTPMWDVVDAQFAKYENKPKGQKKREVGEAVPLGRMGDPADVADPCVFLASDAARYITAQTLNVDGGNWMS